MSEGENALERIIAALPQKDHAGGAPVHLWDPPYCGEIGMRIARDGRWFYGGTPIGRMALVKLFASVLKFEEPDHYYLVTPVEKIGIDVDDAPFIGVNIMTSGEGPEQIVQVETNVGDRVSIGSDHQLRFETETETGGLKPYVHIRYGLECLFSRSLTYDLIELAVEHKGHMGIWSGEQFFEISQTLTT